jgi:hypothetical protein
MKLKTVREILVANPAITSIVGEKIFVAYADKEIESPYVLIESVAQSPTDCKDGVSVMDSYTFLVTAVAKDYGTVETLLELSRKSLDLYSDDEFKGIRFSGLFDAYDGTQDYFVNTFSFNSLITVP